jgi:hypothetical protein
MSTFTVFHEVDHTADYRLFRLLVQACADTVAELDPRDVERVLDDADSAGDLDPFADWLSAQRPDLKPNVSAYLDTH